MDEKENPVAAEHFDSATVNDVISYLADCGACNDRYVVSDKGATPQESWQNVPIWAARYWIDMHNPKGWEMVEPALTALREALREGRITEDTCDHIEGRMIRAVFPTWSSVIKAARDNGRVKKLLSVLRKRAERRAPTEARKVVFLNAWAECPKHIKVTLYAMYQKKARAILPDSIQRPDGGRMFTGYCDDYTCSVTQCHTSRDMRVRELLGLYILNRTGLRTVEGVTRHLGSIAAGLDIELPPQPPSDTTQIPSY